MKQTISTLLLLYSTLLFSQCNWDLHDSLIRHHDWQEIKHHFKPRDLHSYSLIFEELTWEQQEKNEKKVPLNYYAMTDSSSDTPCLHLNGNIAWQYDDEAIHKRFQKYYKKEYVIINIDSISTLPKEKYPYVIMFYNEIAWAEYNKKTKMMQPLTSRLGYYILDRRNNFKYLIYQCWRKKEDKQFFTLLNQ